MRVAILFACLLVAGCGGQTDPNSAPTYGKTGLPSNYRAYVQVVIDGYHSKQYTADESFNALERNCGVNGYSFVEGSENRQTLKNPLERACQLNRCVMPDCFMMSFAKFLSSILRGTIWTCAPFLHASCDPFPRSGSFM
ncbi:hypothetical protein QFZ42_000161 [Variovorax paradoxus]|nr:hypothetical protein [Variovorax paradoxus]